MADRQFRSWIPGPSHDIIARAVMVGKPAPSSWTMVARVYCVKVLRAGLGQKRRMGKSTNTQICKRANEVLADGEDLAGSARRAGRASEQDRAAFAVLHARMLQRRIPNRALHVAPEKQAYEGPAQRRVDRLLRTVHFAVQTY